MMNCIQITSFQPCCDFTNANNLHSDSSAPRVSPPQGLQFKKAPINLTISSSSYLGLKFHVIPQKIKIGASGFKQSTPVCLFGGKGKSENDAEQGSPWKALEKAVSNFKKEPSVEELLRQQIQKQEFYDDNGSGGDNSGSGGGGSGDGSGSGESDDESLSGILDETLQVILATLGFIFLYMFIIEGEEIVTFTKDIIKFLFTRRKSIRLTRFIESWESFLEEISPTEDPDPDWLAREIVNTTTWFDSPTKYRRLLGRDTSEEDY